MDLELYRLIRKNEKQRRIFDGWNINLEEFSVFDFEFGGDVKKDTVDVAVLSHSREGRRSG